MLRVIRGAAPADLAKCAHSQSVAAEYAQILRARWFDDGRKSLGCWVGSTSRGPRLVHLTCVTLIGVAFALLASAACADEPDTSGNLPREQLERVINVLKLQPAAAGASCLKALTDLHATEDQVKVLRRRAKDPDLALALDILESDYENAHEVCGADARRVCAASQQTMGLPSVCAKLNRGGR